ncbi:MAG: ATP-dependent sacrificial sulfur transferase LarE [Syntrophomonas sp.]
MENLLSKYSLLTAKISEMKRVIVAYSGGVDSTLLLKAAYDCLGEENVLAVTEASPLISNNDIETAIAMAKEIGVPHRIIQANELDVEEIISNPPNRCYYCKLHTFSLLIELAHEEGFNSILEGTNYSDLKDYRPGMDAVQSLEMVKSPLLDCKLEKEEIRILAKDLQLANWNQPSAACLASRIPYGDRISLEKLTSIAEAEARLHRLGISNVRVRHHGPIARVEVSREDFALVLNPDFLNLMSREVKACGFIYVTLDVDGYNTGSLNKCLPR